MVGAQDVGARGQQRRRCDDRHLAAHDLQGRNERAAHAGVRDVAHHAHVQVVEGALLLPDGVQIEQRLGGMLVLAVAAVDDVGIDVAGEQARRALLLAAHDDEVGVHGVERLARVGERLAFFRGARRGGEVDDVGGHALARNLEARARACGRLEEEIDDRAAAQRGQLLDGAVVDLLEAARRVENFGDFLDGVLVDVD